MNRDQLNIWCPLCGAEIPLEDVNVSRNIALCRSCNRPFPFLDAISPVGRTPIDLDRPPRGTWLENRADRFVAGATIRTGAGLGCAVPILMVFGMLFLLPTIIMIREGGFLPYGVIVGIPLGLLGLALLWMAALQIAGVVVLSVRGTEGEVFQGVGPFGFRTRFDWWSVSGVYETYQHESRNPRRVLQLVGPKMSLNFGDSLTPDRQNFLVQAIRAELTHRPLKPPTKHSYSMDEL